MEEYFEDLKKSVGNYYKVANLARSKGFDPVNSVECSLAVTMAEKVVSLVKTIYPNISVDKISKRILELENKFGKLEPMVAFVIAHEISDGKFGKFGDLLERIDIGIRIGFSYMTLGVVASPIEGYTGLRLGKTKDLEDYFIVNFSGPIRSAGTTSTCLVLMLIDYLRESFGFTKYDATKEEINRYVCENKDFHERVSNLQYFPSEEEIRFLAERLPIQIDGDPTEKIEVSDFKDLDRVRTNKIRGGMCLAFSEGLAQKVGKAWGRLKRVKENGLVCSGWDWIEDYLVLHKKRESGVSDIEATYIENLVAGRPVYGYPGKSGGFRFRYGRGRTSGFSAASIHPATMGITNGFLSNGTQLKLERPIKGCIITSCDSIDGPIVKLKNGSVKKLYDYKKAKDLYDEIEEIIYLGDILFSIGDVIDRNSDLIKCGYVPEWWEAQLLKMGVDIDFGKMDFEKVIEISREKKVPLHPDFIFYWSQISNEEFFALLKWLNSSFWRGGKLVFDWSKGVREKFSLGKRALELLGIEHEIVLDNIVVGEDARVLLFNLGKKDVYNGEKLEFKVDEIDRRDVLGIVNSMCEFEIKDKAGTFIGARMGRPEKAKLRELVGSPNVLFSIGDNGGKLRNIRESISKDSIKGEFSVFRCKCGFEGIYKKCLKCGKEASRFKFCKKCEKILDGNCKLHGCGDDFWNRRINVKEYFDDMILKMGLKFEDVPDLIKGVKKLNNNERVCENLAKGVLRAKNNLSVNKDGTIRYDATEFPLTHFKLKEIGVNVEKIRELGYLKDINGEDLVLDDQILELMPHDIILPNCSVLGKNRADKVFFNIANFIDEELEKLYDLDRFYNLKSEGDLVGREVVCIAPHNCAGVIGRIIGFSNIQGVLASPFMHAAVRRDCDGDEFSIMLLMDVLLNFSVSYLPSHRGGKQDAPLVLNVKINAGEVDDQILFFESSKKYPLSLYKSAEKKLHSSVIQSSEDICLIRDKLKIGKTGFKNNNFSFGTSDINLGNNNGIYKVLPTMKEKVAAQMDLALKLRSVDENDVARLILERHYIKDIKGNLRRFGRQEFRCSNCNEKYRRVPLRGSCFKCDGKIIFTVSEGSIRKYMEPAMELIRDYEISSYMKEHVELINDYIETIFGKNEKQETL